MNRLIRIGLTSSFTANIRNISKTTILNGNVVNRSNHVLNRKYFQNIFCKVNTSPIRSSYNHVNGQRDQRIVGKWFLCCGGMVYFAIVLGGITRLTESGLSMVTWRLTGEKRPRSDTEWEQEFQRYKQYPEFIMKNPDMTLKEFKTIYWMEYAHRTWGRGIGAIFLLPAIYFWKRNYFNRYTKMMVLAMGGMIALQGLMGWYMVKSGLENRFDDVNDIPRVSQYRLATHLGAAVALYYLFVREGLRIVLPSKEFQVKTINAMRFKRLAIATKGLIFLKALSGSLVAGMDAGLIYNSFPKMADKWIPSDILALQPLLRNITENPTTAQFNHRILGITTVIVVSTLWLLSRRLRLPARAYWAMNAAIATAWFQATLGINTLLHHVPVSLAAAHQSISIFLFSSAIWLTHELRLLKYIPK